MEKMDAYCMINNEHSASSAETAIYEEVLQGDFYLNDKLQYEETCSHFQDQDYIQKMKEFHFHIGMVKKIVKPGCSQEVLNVALTSMSSIVQMLSMMSSGTYPHASL